MENKETPPNQLDPQQKCDQKSVPTMLKFILKQEEPGGPITRPPVAVSDGTPVRTFHRLHRGRGPSSKRKKDNPYIEKQQVILKKVQFLMETLKPVPFIPPKILYFSTHEKLLKKIGLWDFVHIDFDTNVRIDLISQLVATYDSKLRCSYVNKFRIAVNRTNIALALRLPVKRVKGNVGGVEGVDLGSEVLAEEEIEFIEEIVSDWVLLHGDIWSIPSEILNWVGRIKDGHPEKIDWAGLFWFMVEKELTQGEHLIDCYYASHLQYLIKSQHEEVFMLREVDLDVEAKEEEVPPNNVVDVTVGGIKEVREEEGRVMEGPSMELTLGQNIGKKEEEVKNIEMMDAGKCKDEEVEEQGQWLLDGKNYVGEHDMKSCRVEEGRRCSLIDDEKENETIEKAAEDGFDINVLSDDDVLEGDGLAGNLLQAMVGNHLDFSAQGKLCEPLPVDLNSDVQDLASGQSFSINAGKRFMVQDNDISQHLIEDKNKRLRINNSWDHKPVGFGMCMEKMQQSVESFRLMYKEKEKTLQQLDRNQQLLLSELQKRDMMIKYLQKTKLEEIRTRDGELYRLQRELHLMASILDGYKKAIKETQKAFVKYREKSKLPEEPYYIDAGFGGLMLSATEIEKLHKKQEEEYTLNCLILEQKAKELEEDCASHFEEYLEKVNLLDNKLTGLETVMKELIGSCAIQKMKKKLLHS